MNEDKDAGFLASAAAVAHEAVAVCPGCLENYARSEQELHFGACDPYKAYLARPKLTVERFHPIQDRVLVRVIPDPVTTATGLAIPDSARERPLQAEVLKVGPGRPFENGTTWAMQVAAGDVVIFQKHGGEDIRIEDETLKILREDEIMGHFRAKA